MRTKRRIAPQKSAGHRQNRLDFDIAGGPVAHHAQRKSFALGTAVFRPPAIQTIGSEFADNDWFQCPPS